MQQCNLVFLRPHCVVFEKLSWLLVMETTEEYAQEEHYSELQLIYNTVHYYSVLKLNFYSNSKGIWSMYFEKVVYSSNYCLKSIQMS